jgi:hypothetical protein
MSRDNKLFKIKKEIRQGDVILPVSTMVIFVEKRDIDLFFRTRYDQEISIPEKDFDDYFEENKNLLEIFNLFINS